ncbi:DUF4232 domain-containing protein [Actinoplanes sp. NPDC020271]|uniref:DUF4232 domain-containing protein n=1 Tax=Actinoplanes sp. NPDC020271 TaxID=3363896 RepID=UPI0037967EC3
MNWRSTLAVPAVCTAALLALTACKVDTTAGSAPATGQPAGPASPAAAARPETSSATDTAVPAAHKTTTAPARTRTPTSDPGDGQAPDCTTAQLKITLDDGDGASGRIVNTVQFRNTGAACWISGYPAVAARKTDGTKVTFTRSPAGFAGGQTDGRSTPPRITLKTGQTAAAMIDSSSFDLTTGGGCGEVAKVQIGPPTGTQPVTLAWTGGCSGFDVHPLIAGTTGRQG